MKKTEKYIANRFSQILQDLDAYRKSREEEKLHNIRVEIKKVKAIIALISEYNKKFKPRKEFKPLREIFRAAGVIREPHVLLQLLLKYGVHKMEQDSTLDEDRAAIEQFIKNIPSYTALCNRATRKLAKYGKHLGHDEIRRSLRKREKKIKRSLTDVIKFESIHTTRKEIKQSLYLSEIYNDLKKKKTKFFNMLQEVIGSVHDKQMLIIRLRKSQDPGNQSALKDLHNSIESDAKRIVQLCREFYGKKKITLA